MFIRLLSLLILVGIFTNACIQTEAPEQQELIIENPMKNFGTIASNVLFYYSDLENATKFYNEVLGLRIAADYEFAKIMQVSPKSFITLVDASKGMHTADEPKTTAVALITDQLDEWWNYINTQDVALRSDSYSPVEGRPHDGFVVIDPEGYFLEFERFNVHEENKSLIPILNKTTTLYPEAEKTNVPPGLGFKATVVWFYYKDIGRVQQFYENVIGLDLLVDQGPVKIYQVGPSGYFGLVDEQHGMHNFTEKKAVTISFITTEIDKWYAHLSNQNDVQMHSKKIETEENYQTFIAYDPGGYYLQWSVFNDVPNNIELLNIIENH
jgi:predicted enzyme related to lactoylglutathione lyase/catechol 2,3-dioxygenase-like lactoylglutathione lyase family enzyme